MTYLITGATGFIGGKLVKTLLAQGHSVNYLARRIGDHLDSRAAFHRWEPDQDPPLDSIPDLDAVIHLAGEPVSQRWNAKVKQRIRFSRVDGTRRLVETLKRVDRKPAVLVCASAVGYYGDRADQVLSEESGPGSGFLADLCVEWEREALRAKDFGLRVVPIRIGVVLGKEGGALPKMLIPFKLGVGGRFGDGKQWVPWIHVDDLIRLLIFAAESAAANGPMNGVSPRPVQNREFTRELARTLHRPAILPVPAFALKAMLGEMAAVVLASMRAIPEAAQQQGFAFTYADLSEALKSLV